MFMSLYFNLFIFVSLCFSSVAACAEQGDTVREEGAVFLRRYDRNTGQTLFMARFQSPGYREPFGVERDNNRKSVVDIHSLSYGEWDYLKFLGQKLFLLDSEDELPSTVSAITELGFCLDGKKVIIRGAFFSLPVRSSAVRSIQFERAFTASLMLLYIDSLEGGEQSLAREMVLGRYLNSREVHLLDVFNKNKGDLNLLSKYLAKTQDEHEVGRVVGPFDKNESVGQP